MLSVGVIRIISYAIKKWGCMDIIRETLAPPLKVFVDGLQG